MRKRNDRKMRGLHRIYKEGTSGVYEVWHGERKAVQSMMDLFLCGYISVNFGELDNLGLTD